jgi:hypothetical protein
MNCVVKSLCYFAVCHLAPRPTLCLLPLLASVAPSRDGQQGKYGATFEISEKKKAAVTRKGGFP